MPLGRNIHQHEQEAGEETVLCRWNQIGYLTWRTRQIHRPFRVVNLYMLILLSSAIVDILVVESLAQTIREVAVVALQRVGKRISLSLEGDALVMVVVQRLVDGGRRAVGRNQQ